MTRSAKGVDGAGLTHTSTGSVLPMGTGGVPKGAEASKSTTRGRSGSSDRTFQVIAVLGGLCLIGFIVFVAVRAPAKSPRTLGVASLEAPPPAVLHAGSAPPALFPPPLRPPCRLVRAGLFPAPSRRRRRVDAELLPRHAGHRQLLCLVVPALPVRISRHRDGGRPQRGWGGRGRGRLQRRNGHPGAEAVARRSRQLPGRRRHQRSGGRQVPPRGSARHLLHRCPRSGRGLRVRGPNRYVAPALGESSHPPGLMRSGIEHSGSGADEHSESTTGPVVDRTAAFGDTSPPVPRTFFYWLLGAVAVLGLRGLLLEHLVSSTGLNPAPQKNPVTATTGVPSAAPVPAGQRAPLGASLTSFIGLAPLRTA